MLCICHCCLISDVDFGVLTSRTDPLILRPAHIELLTKIFRRRLDFKIVSGSLSFPCLTLQVSFLYQQLRQVAITVNICNIGCFTPQPSFQIPVLMVNADFLSDCTFPVLFTKCNKTQVEEDFKDLYGSKSVSALYVTLEICYSPVVPQQLQLYGPVPQNA